MDADLSSASVPPEHFDAQYAADDDPWRYATSPYEQGKYARTLACLTERRYGSALEIGCSIGVFTALLAARVDALLAIDGSRLALERAIERCRDLPHVRFERRIVPHEFPPGEFDLIIFAEVGYYLSVTDLCLARDEIVQHIVPGGSVVLVHYTPEIDDAPLRGDDVHDAFMTLVPEVLRHITRERNPRYLIDVFQVKG